VLKPRLIPCLLLQNGMLVRSETFSLHQVIGNPLHEVKRFNDWSVDELIYLDISRDGTYEHSRADHKVKPLVSSLEVLDAIAAACFVPLTFGGRIRTIDDMSQRFQRGSDKITVNTAAVETPRLITDAAKRFGSQAVVVSIDVKRHVDGSAEVFTRGGQMATGLLPAAWAAEAEDRGAGEIFLNSIDRDGTGEGYDIELIASVTDAVGIPVIACGGVGRYEDFAPAILDGGASAVSAANIFHFKELSDRNAKRAMRRAGVDVRLPV